LIPAFKADVIVGKGNNLSDVKGKKIGVDGINSFSYFFVLKSLEKAGLTEGDVEFKYTCSKCFISITKGGNIYRSYL
jgi:ABC-type nitrate/sulfonate/bicarbonate transport system substrate-binding protein